MRYCIIIAAACVLIPSAALAEQQWQREYGGSSLDGANWIRQTADGGYVVAAATCSFGAGAYDAWLIKTDASGDTVWTRIWGGPVDDWASSVEQTADGGYIVAGYTESFGAGGTDFWLVKTDPDGDTLWTRTYGGLGWEQAYSVRQTADHGYVVVGYTTASGGADIWLVRTDSLGDTLWTRTYDGGMEDQGCQVQLTADHGYIVAGYGMPSGTGGHDAWLIKTDSLGDTLWTRAYGGDGDECAFSVAQTADLGYVLAGSTSSFGAGQLDAWLVKTDSLGDTLWTRSFGGSDLEIGFSVAQTAGHGYVIAGATQSFGAGGSDAWLIATDSCGDTVWTRTYGGASPDEAYSVEQTADGGYVVAAATSSFGAGAYDVLLIKTGPDGSVAVAEPREPSGGGRIAATIARGVLMFGDRGEGTGEGAGLLDASGRKVLDLRPGANDVSHLPAGTYFVVAASRGSSLAGCRKLILTR